MRIRITSESGVLTGMVDADQRMDGVAEDPCFGLLLITLCCRTISWTDILPSVDPYVIRVNNYYILIVLNRSITSFASCIVPSC